VEKAIIGFFAGVALTTLAFFMLENARDDAPTADPNVLEVVSERSPNVPAEREAGPEAPKTSLGPAGSENDYSADLEPIESVTTGGLRFIPALPGLPGYEIYVPPPRPLIPAEQLAAEARDQRWAPGMENRILAELSLALSAMPVNQIHVECRMTWCGTVIDAAELVDFETPGTIAAHLEESVGFGQSQVYSIMSPETDGFMAIWLRADR
jgi:hypothetical protein